MAFKHLSAKIANDLPLTTAERVELIEELLVAFRNYQPKENYERRKIKSDIRWHERMLEEARRERAADNSRSKSRQITTNDGGNG